MRRRGWQGSKLVQDFLKKGSGHHSQLLSAAFSSWRCLDGEGFVHPEAGLSEEDRTMGLIADFPLGGGAWWEEASQAHGWEGFVSLSAPPRLCLCARCDEQLPSARPFRHAC